MLSIEDIKTVWPMYKVNKRSGESFKVVKAVATHAYHSDLLVSVRIQGVFHVSCFDFIEPQHF